MATTFDPLNCIPSAAAVRIRLAEIQEEARRLDVLLKTAEEIEKNRETSRQGIKAQTNGGDAE